MMYTLQRIQRLLAYCHLPPMVNTAPTVKRSLHTVLDSLDAAFGIDSATLPSTECTCLWHIGKCCAARRAVGARLALLEEAATQEITRRIPLGALISVVNGGKLLLTG